MEEPEENSSLTKGSQECNEMVCDHCSESDDLLIKADGYCVTCKAFICKTCIQSHRRIKMLRGHTILGPADMPKSKPPGDINLTSQESLTIECTDHTGELIKYFCKNHNIVGCMDCITLDHRSCVDIMRVDDAAKATSVKTELDVFEQRLKTVAEEIKILLQMAEKNHLQVEDQQKQLLKDVQKFKEAVFETVNKLVSEIEMQVKETIKKDQAKIDQLVMRCTTLQEDIELKSKEFDSLRKSNQTTKEFIIMNQSAFHLEKWEDDRKDLAANAEPGLYEFCPDVSLRQIIGKVSYFGRIVAKADAEHCGGCKVMTLKTHLHKLSCGHQNCDGCSDCTNEIERTCTYCGKVTVPCKRCKTAVDKSSMSTLACGHDVCLPCRKHQTENEAPCSDCGLITGNQPTGSLSETTKYENGTDILVLDFMFSNGRQESFHPCPGNAYNGGSFECRLSNDETGLKVTKTLKTAFDRKLVCKIDKDKIVPNIELYQGQIEEINTRYQIERCEEIEEMFYDYTDEYRSYLSRVKIILQNLGINA